MQSTTAHRWAGRRQCGQRSTPALPGGGVLAGPAAGRTSCPSGPGAPAPGLPQASHVILILLRLGSGLRRPQTRCGGMPSPWPRGLPRGSQDEGRGAWTAAPAVCAAAPAPAPGTYAMAGTLPSPRWTSSRRPPSDGDDLRSGVLGLRATGGGVGRAHSTPVFPVHGGL